ncbi:hypothetical protein [Mesorhizobium sp. M2A.F.Ca.ET.043.02.1.1]|nr:hypothetical protein [Mesorhizobium sp. M2A.F.Ca.ET.043.02.1.1]
MGGGGNNPDFWADLMLDALCSRKSVLAAIFGLGLLIGFAAGRLL